MLTLAEQITEARDRLLAEIERLQDRYDDLPEHLQMSPIGDAMETKIERLMDGVAEMDDTLKTLRQISKKPPV